MLLSDRNSFTEERSYTFLPTFFKTKLDWHIIFHSHLIFFASFTPSSFVLSLFILLIFVWLPEK